jgi:transposase-like protein
MTMKEQREAVRLYKEKAGTAAETAKIYGVHFCTIFHTLDRFGVERHRPRSSVSASATMKKRWERQKEAEKRLEQLEWSPDMRDMYLVAEQPSPVEVAPKPIKRKPRKRKSWWQRLTSKLFGG